MTNYIFITGGVVSSLGKGITSASLAAILEARGLRVTLIKLDPYINVDPGTMSPFQHGEVFVTEDGPNTAPRIFAVVPALRSKSVAPSGILSRCPFLKPFVKCESKWGRNDRCLFI